VLEEWVPVGTKQGGTTEATLSPLGGRGLCFSGAKGIYVSWTVQRHETEVARVKGNYRGSCRGARVRKHDAKTDPLGGRCLGFIGAGAMAEALVGGLISARVLPADRILVTNRSDCARLHGLAGRWGVHVTYGKAELARRCQVLILATKPVDIPGVLRELEGLVGPGHLLVSVAAGIPCALMEERFPGIPVVRAMPNTSCRVKESATAVALGCWATAEHEALAHVIFGAVGQVVTVPEGCLNAVTGLSGSGPAYVYLLMEALAEAGTKAGLDPQVSRFLTWQTVLGAARMVQETGEDPASLRRKVTSPNGTTMAALQALQAMGFDAALHEAVRRATERSQELGKEIMSQRTELAVSVE